MAAFFDNRRSPATSYEHVDVALARQYRDQARAAAAGAGEGAEEVVRPLVNEAKATTGFDFLAQAATFLTSGGMADGDWTEVRNTDAGQHEAVLGEIRTDGTAAAPGEMIDNEGRYIAVAGALQRRSNTQRQLGASETSRAENEADRAEAAVGATKDVVDGAMPFFERGGYAIIDGSPISYTGVIYLEDAQGNKRLLLGMRKTGEIDIGPALDAAEGLQNAASIEALSYAWTRWIAGGLVEGESGTRYVAYGLDHELDFWGGPLNLSESSRNHNARLLALESSDPPEPEGDGPTAVLAYGDSLTGWVGAPGATAAFDGLPIIHCGVPGQYMEGITGRLRATPLACVTDGMSIPTSGSIEFLVQPNTRWATPSNSEGLPVQPTAAVLAGVRGVIARTTGNNLSFTPISYPSAPIPLQRRSYLYVDVKTRPFGAPAREPEVNIDNGIYIVWGGRNDLTFNSGEIGGVTESGLVRARPYFEDALIYFRDKPGCLPLFIGATNAMSEGVGTQNFNWIVEHNEWYQGKVNDYGYDPRCFVDVASMVFQAVPSDATAIANKTPPSSLMSDDIHFNGSGSAWIVNNCFVARCRELGYL